MIKGEPFNRKGEANKDMYLNAQNADEKHPDYPLSRHDWDRVRDCVQGESTIKRKREAYLPRPGGMTGEYAEAYDSYIERAHFPLIASYALQGALGLIITKLPEFNVPKELEYILEEATKDGRSLRQLFLEVVIEILLTGRVPLVVDIIPDENEFRFVQYKAESFINWKTSSIKAKDSLILATFEEEVPDSNDLFSHDTVTMQRALIINKEGKYVTHVYGPESEAKEALKVEYEEMMRTPQFMGKPLDELPVTMAGSINNSFDMQPVPLLAVANASVQIYRKQADLANSEFLSCNPTLIVSGVSNEEDLPNVVGSSVLVSLPDPQARAYYTRTDTMALSHVSRHIEDLYEEAITHGVSILSNRKGVESAEALRIRQATQSASIYSIYLSALNAIRDGLLIMARWGGYNEDEVILDAPSSLTYGIADPAVIKQVVEGFGAGVIPLTVVHRYLVSSGLIDQTVGFEDYVDMLKTQNEYITTSVLSEGEDEGSTSSSNEEGEGDDDNTGGTSGKSKTQKKKAVVKSGSKTTMSKGKKKKQAEGSEDIV